MPYCDRCGNRPFRTEDDLAKHKRDSNSHCLCDDCDRDFATEDRLNQHLADVHHYCAECDEGFLSKQNLKAHLKSSIHQPKTVACPFVGCDKFVVFRSALLLHLEEGKCSSGANRATVNRLVRQCDKNNIITDPSRPLTNSEYTAGPSSWNEDVKAYECYLCHGLYPTLADLKKHLASPRHQDKIYICPHKSCSTRFTTLSGLCQHIESEKCRLSRFNLKAVQTIVDDLLGKIKRLAV